ncbi:MAG: hypothetical protein Q4C96_03390 [Planctomycetia bacterium]|nr:hypothetical protein [Planctomycetia bacterium]
MAGCPSQKEERSGEEISREKKAEIQMEKSPITDQEAILFGQELERTLTAGDGMMYVRSMDWSAITDAVLRDLPENREEGTYRRKDVLESLSQSGGIARRITEKVKRGGAYHFLRVKNVPGAEKEKKILAFRFIDPDGGVDYHDLYIHRGMTGSLMIYDIYLYFYGEKFSENIRQTLVPELYVGGTSGFGDMIVEMSEVVQILFREHMKTIEMLFTAYEEGDYQKTLDIFDALPEELKRNKSLLIIRLNAALRHMDPQEYLFVLADIREKIPDDPCVDFLSLDYFFQKEMYEEALRSLDRIEHVIGPDAYLNFFRCVANEFMGRPQEVNRLYQQAMQQDPRLKNDRDFRRYAPSRGTQQTGPAEDPSSF